SKGFVTFKVKKMSSLSLGTTISNTASIYFDYNTPVVTNTVTDTVFTNIFLNNQQLSFGIIVKAFPNPFINTTTIAVSGLEGKYDFELFDVSGRLMPRIPSVNTSQFQLRRDNIASGIYIY